jgi:hypothetical protein
VLIHISNQSPETFQLGILLLVVDAVTGFDAMTNILAFYYILLLVTNK